ncbi:hypothetical protein BaRGS_00005868 [Batillaria attramentaria]|uniref:Uncharacterized protein n=1 Tax=Batillaria attramentaria TaxID=370345 RepID=A0ABD0LTL6_9CAEN
MLRFFSQTYDRRRPIPHTCFAYIHERNIAHLIPGLGANQDVASPTHNYSPRVTEVIATPLLVLTTSTFQFQVAREVRPELGPVRHGTVPLAVRKLLGDNGPLKMQGDGGQRSSCRRTAAVQHCVTNSQRRQGHTLTVDTDDDEPAYSAVKFVRASKMPLK